GERLDGWGTEPVEGAQLFVLVEGDRLADLLDGDDAPGELDEAHHVPRDTAGQRREHRLGPLLQGDLPRAGQEGGVAPGGSDLQGVSASRRSCPSHGAAAGPKVAGAPLSHLPESVSEVLAGGGGEVVLLFGADTGAPAFILA